MKLATIEQILNLIPIDNADNIVLASILGWDVVVKKIEFKVGDLCIYIPIDTMVDSTLPCFSFLANKNSEKFIRIKTIRIRGKWSQGLAIPLNFLTIPLVNLNIGDDVSEKLKVIKYEKENIILNQSNTNNLFCDFPVHYISKTDEDNLRTRYNILSKLYNQHIYITKKMDGSSMTLIWNSTNNEFLVCSRRLIVGDGSVMYQYVEKEKLKEKIISIGKDLAIQGEFAGPKINGNQMGLRNYEFYVFTIKNLQTNKYYNWSDIINICTRIGIKTVPEVSNFICDESWNIDKFQELSNAQIYKQYNGKQVSAEGIVIRPYEPVYSPELQKMLSVKVINQLYKD